MVDEPIPLFVYFELAQMMFLSLFSIPNGPGSYAVNQFQISTTKDTSYVRYYRCHSRA